MSPLGRLLHAGVVGRGLMALMERALEGGNLLSPDVLVPAGAGLAGAIPYTPLGQRAAQAILMSRPAWAPAAANAVRNVGGLLMRLAAGSTQRRKPHLLDFEWSPTDRAVAS
jgi:hypothetical protein